MSSTPVTIRDVLPGDAAVVAALLTELGHPTGSGVVPARLDAVEREGGAALLAVGGTGRPLGLITLTAHAVLHAPGPVGLITGLVVTGVARGQGVGRRLVDAAKRWAAERGCVRLTVTSGEHRADAHAFYSACGLAYTGRRFTTVIDSAT